MLEVVVGLVLALAGWWVVSLALRRPPSKNMKSFALEAVEESLFKRTKEILVQPYAGNDIVVSADRMRLLLKGEILDPESCVKNLKLFFAAHRALSLTREWGLNIRATVQYNLFLGTICALGTSTQRAEAIAAARKGELGCFCLTEKGAGVLSGMIVNTTATLQDDHFVLSTPDEAAHKTWISQGLVARWGVVIARLVVGGKDLGPHAFIVDMEAAGIERHDMPAKSAFNSLDNAVLVFNNVRIPHTSMLGRFSAIVAGEYRVLGTRPFQFYQLAQRLLSGRLCIAASSLTALGIIRDDVERYMQTRQVFTSPTTQAPLLQLPYVRDAMDQLDCLAWVFRAYINSCEAEFAALIESDGDVPAGLVDAIAVAKCEAIEFATMAALRLRQLVGAYGLRGDTPFGDMDIFLCMRFAEGDTRVLQQKAARDLLRDVSRGGPSRLASLAASVAARSLAATACLLAAPGLLRLSRDRLLLRLAWDLRAVGRNPDAMLQAWLALGNAPYALARLHAVAAVHDRVVAHHGASRQTAVFAEYYAAQDLTAAL